MLNNNVNEDLTFNPQVTQFQIFSYYGYTQKHMLLVYISADPNNTFGKTRLRI